MTYVNDVNSVRNFICKADCPFINAYMYIYEYIYEYDDIYTYVLTIYFNNARVGAIRSSR